MKERPILFSAPLVRAILAGTKTQTRRIVRELPGNRGAPVGDHVKWFDPGAEDPTRWCGHDGLGSDGWVKCPYGVAGDRLWVRETHALGNPLSDGSPSQRVAYRADLTWGAHCPGVYVRHGFVIDGSGRHPWPEEMRGQSLGLGGFGDRWRPSIHMPRWASRIDLEVTGVRVERLQAIRCYDIRAEGVDCPEHDFPGGFCSSECSTLRRAFSDLWDSINAKRAPWSSNPWVWIVEFQRVQP